MNLAQALDVALPEIPARVLAQKCPQLHPDVVFKEHIVDGRPLVRVLVPQVDAIFNLDPETWRLVSCFNGQRSYEDVAQAYFEETGQSISIEQVHDVADDFESMDFWYKTPRERNIALMLKSADERRKVSRGKNRWRDLGFVTFPAFNPDNFLVWLERRIHFVFTWWFTLLTLAIFGAMGAVFFWHWSQVSRDTLQFFNFAAKTWLDLAVFWGITLILAGIHEVAHGVTCRHFGGKVAAMGFALIYLAPAFYTDTSEGAILCGPFRRILISIAGVWSEMYICVVATFTWWLTAPGTAVHEVAYVFMLMTGIATVLLNWNPLMKLDGYHILCDALGILDLKETSTAYVSAWVKRYIFRLPVEVPYVPKRRRFGFAFYAIASGLYSYTVLYILARFVGNIFRNFNPEWSFIPELGTGALIFRSRLRTLANFMKFLYLDKKDRVRGWFAFDSLRSALTVVAVFIFLLLPLWHESIVARFVLQAAERAEIRAELPGIVTRVNADEGQMVSRDAPLIELRNLPLASQLARTSTDYKLATAELSAAELQYSNTGAALQKRDQMAAQDQIVNSEVATLQLRSPITGTVTTARLADRLGTYVTSGTELAEVADMRTMRAQIYVSEYEMYRYHPESNVLLEVEGTFRKWQARIHGVSTASSQIVAGLIDLSRYKGMSPPTFYEVSAIVSNPNGILKPGMNGTARIYGSRRSLAGLIYQSAEDVVRRKLW